LYPYILLSPILHLLFSFLLFPLPLSNYYYSSSSICFTFYSPSFGFLIVLGSVCLVRGCHISVHITSQSKRQSCNAPTRKMKSNSIIIHHFHSKTQLKTGKCLVHEVSSFLRCAVQITIFLGFCAVLVGGKLRKFWDNLSLPSSRVAQSETSAWTLEERADRLSRNVFVNLEKIRCSIQVEISESFSFLNCCLYTSQSDEFLNMARCATYPLGY
jgi:hypothetical protein